MKSKWKYEVIIYWSDNDDAYIAEARPAGLCR